MFSLLFLTVLYFLPSIIGRDKRDATGIFLVNLFLGWTLIGWVVAFLWACASDRPIYAQCAPAGVVRFCSHCGTPAVSLVQYCGSCGARV
jgi:T4 superinfection immunity protein